jgi:hypothetical protein
MTFRKILKEEFIVWVSPSHGEGHFAVYVNPSQSEIIKCGNEVPPSDILYGSHMAPTHKSIRFTIEPIKKKIYIAPYFVYHSSMADAVGIPYEPVGQFTGTADVVEGKLKYTGSDSKPMKEYIGKYDFSWADKYFTEPVNETLKRKNLKEEFLEWIRPPRMKHSVPVYKNPTSKEMRETLEFNRDVEYDTDSKYYYENTLRFIVLAGRKEVYIFPSTVLHYEVGRRIGLGTIGAGNLQNLNPAIFCGHGKYEGGKIRFTGSDSLWQKDDEFCERASKLDWSFADRFFTQPVKKIINSGNKIMEKK